MGCCLSSADVQTKYAVGTTSQRSSDARETADAVALLSGSQAFSSWIEVQVTCQNLKKADTFSQSDPMAVLLEQTQSGGWREIGRTEAISNTNSPKFVKRFRLLYNFEAIQSYRLEVMDVDKKHNPETVTVSECNNLGHVEFRLSDLVTSNRSLTLDLKNTKQPSSVKLVAEEMSAAREVLTLQLSATRLKNVDLMSKSDPFLQVCRGTETGQWQPVFKTEVVDNSLNPTWNPFVIKALQLNNGDPHRPLLLQVFDYETNGKHRLLGEAKTTALSLEEILGDGSLPLALPGQGPNGGELQVRMFSVEQRPSFLDYLQAGAEISFMVAVDYTASNKDPRDPQSLHYIQQGVPTPYEEAIVGIARVLEAYDNDKVFNCYGFGAKLPGSTVQHCIPLGSSSSGACNGIAGVLAAYRLALHTYALSGPTLFTPLLRQAVSVASQPSQSLRYHVLLILTDGCIHDMQDTIDSIVQASSLPLSILIVGVGESPELAKMEALDSDKKMLVDRQGNKGSRDIVQFVKFLDHRNDGVALATELLAELPGQFLEWTRTNNILPPVARPPLPEEGSLRSLVSAPPAL